MFNREDVIYANKLVGEAGIVLNESSLTGAFASVHYYDSELERIICVVRSVMQNHPFENGNKRTGVALLSSGCSSLGLDLKVSDDGWVHFAVDSVTERWSVGAILNWVTSVLEA
jgi:hypothetical protein